MSYLFGVFQTIYRTFLFRYTMNFLLTFAIFFFPFQLTFKKKKKKEKERNKIVIDNQNKKTHRQSKQEDPVLCRIHNFPT